MLKLFVPGEQTVRHSKKEVKPTLVGLSAILMWATLALLTKLSGAVPPFQLTALSFSIAFLVGLPRGFHRGKLLHHLKLPKQIWFIGVVGLFGYHFFYFMALRNAPAIEASLIAYLWPLLIVLLSALLPNEKLRWFHIIGALVSFIGTGILVTKGKPFAFNLQYSLGYLSALICAFIWSSYSVLSKRFYFISSDAIVGFCGVTAILAWLCHRLFEQTVWPVGTQWIAVMCLGLGPIGLAFFTWDYGVKHGNIKVLGSLSYAAPLLSTILLVAFRLEEASSMIGLACLLIVGGAILATGDFLRN